MKKSAAYTLIELLIVISLLGVFSVGGYLAFTTARDNQLIHQTADVTSDIFRRASIYSQNARKERSWGVRSDDKKTYALLSQTADGEVTVESNFSLPESLVFTEPFLVWFTKATGAVSMKQDIIITSPRGKTSIITLNTNTTITVTVP